MARMKQVPNKSQFSFTPGQAYIKHVLAEKQAKVKYLGLHIWERSSAYKTGGIKKAKRVSAGIRALGEIRQFQRSTRLCVNRLGFQRLVKEIVLELFPSKNLRIQSIALEALQVE